MKSSRQQHKQRKKKSQTPQDSMRGLHSRERGLKGIASHARRKRMHSHSKGLLKRREELQIKDESGLQLVFRTRKEGQLLSLAHSLRVGHI